MAKHCTLRWGMVRVDPLQELGWNYRMTNLQAPHFCQPFLRGLIDLRRVPTGLMTMMYGRAYGEVVGNVGSRCPFGCMTMLYYVVDDLCYRFVSTKCDQASGDGGSHCLTKARFFGVLCCDHARRTCWVPLSSRSMGFG